MVEKAAQAEKNTLESATAGALRAIDEVRELLEAATSDDLAASVREKLDASREALERVAREKGGPAGEALAAAERSIREELDELEERVRQNPIGALLVAGGVGLLLGLLLACRR